MACHAQRSALPFVAPARHRFPGEPALASREVAVRTLIERGLSYADVADHLSIRPRTVARHLQSISATLGVDSRAEAAAFAIAQGLV